MRKYHVMYFYLASGMEGRPDIRDYGFIEAESEKKACEMVAIRNSWDYTDGLYAKKHDDSSKWWWEDK